MSSNQNEAGISGLYKHDGIFHITYASLRKEGNKSLYDLSLSVNLDSFTQEASVKVSSMNNIMLNLPALFEKLGDVGRKKLRTALEAYMKEVEESEEP